MRLVIRESIIGIEVDNTLITLPVIPICSIEEIGECDGIYGIEYSGGCNYYIKYDGNIVDEFTISSLGSIKLVDRVLLTGQLS